MTWRGFYEGEEPDTCGDQRWKHSIFNLFTLLPKHYLYMCICLGNKPKINNVLIEIQNLYSNAKDKNKYAYFVKKWAPCNTELQASTWNFDIKYLCASISMLAQFLPLPPSGWRNGFLHKCLIVVTLQRRREKFYFQ